MKRSRLFDHLPDFLLDSSPEFVEEGGGEAVWTRGFSFLQILHSRFHLLECNRMEEQMIMFICDQLRDVRENLVNCWLPVDGGFLLD